MLVDAAAAELVLDSLMFGDAEAGLLDRPIAIVPSLGEAGVGDRAGDLQSAVAVVVACSSAERCRIDSLS
jgi:hypothetical protein